MTPQTFPRASYYKVPFQQALSLLGSRQVYLEAGMVYVPLGKLGEWLCVCLCVTRYPLIECLLNHC